MKKRFSNIALVLVAVAAIAFTDCKDNNPKIEGQWVVVGDSKLYDISTTKPGYLIIGNSNSYLSEKHKLSADHYFIVKVIRAVLLRYRYVKHLTPPEK